MVCAAASARHATNIMTIFMFLAMKHVGHARVKRQKAFKRINLRAVYRNKYAEKSSYKASKARKHIVNCMKRNATC